MEAFRRLQRQLLTLLDDAADEIRQAAVGIGNVSAALEHHDMRGFIEPPQPCRRARTACNAADDDYLLRFVFHLNAPFAHLHRLMFLIIE